MFLSLETFFATDFKDFEIVTADTKHNVYKFDIKGKLQLKFGKTDITGASSFLAVHDQKYLLQGGLDRYARIFDLQSGTRLAKVYTGSKVNYLLMLDDDQVGIDKPKVTKDKKRKPEPEDEEEQEAQNDKLWHHLDKSKQNSVKKARK